MVENALVDNKPYPLADGQDPLDLESYLDREPRRHIIALGLIADATAENDMTARSMLGVALGIWGMDQIEAAFLGERIGTLTARMKAICDVSPDHDARTAALEWMKRADTLARRRDDIIHRPLNVGVDRGQVGRFLGRSRRTHSIEPLRAKGEELVSELVVSVAEGKQLLLNYVLAAHPAWTGRPEPAEAPGVI